MRIDLQRVRDVDPEDAAAVVYAFLLRCRAWATEREIPKLQDRLREHPTTADAAKLHQWTTWRDFVDHALTELAGDTLDPWFADRLAPPEEPPCPS